LVTGKQLNIGGFLLIVIAVYMLSNIEREKVVVELYNQGKNTREIAKELRMSFRDIGLILRKAAASLDSENSHGQQQ
jgi:DNA-binding NarL/FixJ family response regulator